MGCRQERQALILGGATTPLFVHADAPWPDLAQGAKRILLFPTRPARALSLRSGFVLGAGASASPLCTLWVSLPRVEAGQVPPEVSELRCGPAGAVQPARRAASRLVPPPAPLRLVMWHGEDAPGEVLFCPRLLHA